MRTLTSPSFCAAPAAELPPMPCRCLAYPHASLQDLLESTSIARALAYKNNYELVPNREITGLGLANFMGGWACVCRGSGFRVFAPGLGSLAPGEGPVHRRPAGSRRDCSACALIVLLRGAASCVPHERQSPS